MGDDGLAMPPPEVLIGDAPDRDRYEARIAGELAGILEYAQKRGRIALIHTEVVPAFEGQGVGSALVRFALDDARRRGLRVIATCPYVQSYLDRHPGDDDLVDTRWTLTVAGSLLRSKGSGEVHPFALAVASARDD